MSKAEDAALLFSLGFTYLEIARELYPEDYRRYRETGDPRLRKILVRRVWKLLRLAREQGGTRELKRVGPNDGWDPELDDTGGERDRLAHRAPVQSGDPARRKAGLSGAGRQFVEYEQFIYRIYRDVVADMDEGYVLWGTAKALHARAFNEFYALHKANVWGPRSRSAPALAYAYSVLSMAAVLHGHALARARLGEWLRRAPRQVIDILPHVTPIVAKYAVLPVIA